MFVRRIVLSFARAYPNHPKGKDKNSRSSCPYTGCLLCTTRLSLRKGIPFFYGVDIPTAYKYDKAIKAYARVEKESTGGQFSLPFGGVQTANATSVIQHKPLLYYSRRGKSDL